MTGVQYCDEIIGSLCHTMVSAQDAVAFASVLRELKIPSSFIGRLIYFQSGFGQTYVLAYNLYLGLLRNCVL